MPNISLVILFAFSAIANAQDALINKSTFYEDSTKAKLFSTKNWFGIDSKEIREVRPPAPADKGMEHAYGSPDKADYIFYGLKALKKGPLKPVSKKCEKPKDQFWKVCSYTMGGEALKITYKDMKMDVGADGSSYEVIIEQGGNTLSLGRVVIGEIDVYDLNRDGKLDVVAGIITHACGGGYRKLILSKPDGSLEVVLQSDIGCC